MIFLKWAFLVLLSGLLGVLVVKFLTVHPKRMSLSLFITCTVLFGLGLLVFTRFQQRSLFFAILITLGVFLISYLGTTRIILDREETREIPDLIRNEDDPGSGHTAVIYFSHGEPETYNPIGWINQFKEFDEQGIPFVPLIARPFFLHALRKKYLSVGKSDHRDMHGQMMSRLEEMYRAEGDLTTRFYLSFLDDDPRPDAAVIQALNDGASRIIVSEVFLTISNHTAEGEELIKELDIEQRFGVPVEFTGPLFDSDPLMKMFLKKANAHIGDTPKENVGVLLVGHGQPDEWDIEWPTETEHELQFRYDVLELLAENGYNPNLISLAWMEFKEPKPAEKIEEFLANGIKKLLFFSTAISADAIHSQYDIPELVYQADYPQGFPIVDLGAWNDHPLAIQAIKEKIDLAWKRA
jgi:protoheme ferro-lyase